MNNSLNVIQSFKIKSIKNSINSDEFIWIVNNFKIKKNIKNLLKKNNIPYLDKLGYLIISKIYFELVEKINFLINTNISFCEIEIKTLETVFEYLVSQENCYKTQPQYIYNFIILVHEKEKIINVNKSLISELNFFYKNNINQKVELINNKQMLTIVFKDSYNRMIETFTTSIDDTSYICKIFNIYNFEKIKIAKIIKDRVIESVISHYLDGFSIDFNEYEKDLIQYSKENEELCVQFLNLKSGKSIIIYPIVFDSNTGMISQIGNGMGQLRLI